MLALSESLSWSMVSLVPTVIPMDWVLLWWKSGIPIPGRHNGHGGLNSRIPKQANWKLGNSHALALCTRSHPVLL